MARNARTMSDSIEAAELERAADWRIRRFGEDPSDEISANAAKLLQKLADEVRGLVDSPAYTEYLAILNWLGEFDMTDDFAERAHDYRVGIGVDHFPENGEAYFNALITIAGYGGRLAQSQSQRKPESTFSHRPVGPGFRQGGGWKRHTNARRILPQSSIACS